MDDSRVLGGSGRDWYLCVAGWDHRMIQAGRDFGRSLRLGSGDWQLICSSWRENVCNHLLLPNVEFTFKKMAKFQVRESVADLAHCNKILFEIIRIKITAPIYTIPIYTILYNIIIMWAIYIAFILFMSFLKDSPST